MKDGLIKLREYVRQDKPKKIRPDFKFTEPLEHGWLLRYLLPLEDFSWGRWDHWARTTESQRVLEPIPEIHFSPDPAGRKAWEVALGNVTKYGDWRGWSSWHYFDYLLDWVLFGLGYPDNKEEPKTREDTLGASERLYQCFNLEPMLAFPHDYLGDILAENSHGQRSGFFPTPFDVCSMMVRMQMETGEDCRAKTVCDPASGTGRMLLAASNHSYRLYGMDIDRTVIKASIINGYLYAPWLVKPFKFFDHPVTVAANGAAIAIKQIKQLELIPA